MRKPRGVVAAGHPLTASTAQLILEEGGNAFDAAIASLFTACVVEPALASLGGGGFLLARPCTGEPCLYDFFAETPSRKSPVDALDFRSITVDFGAATQEFHFGCGSVAVPGVVRGMFETHSDHGSMPMKVLVEPAAAYAREGVELSDFQAYTIGLLEAIFTSTASMRAIYGSPARRDEIITAGELLCQPDLAACLEALALEGDALFYQGDIASAIAKDMRESGGHLSIEDLTGYRAVRRRPLGFEFRGAKVLTNPPPSSGGLLIAFAAIMLEATTVPRLGSHEHITRLARIMELTGQARIDAGLTQAVNDDAATHLLHPEYLRRWREQITGRPHCSRGTTHISIIDRAGNAASLSISNGEGSAYVAPGTGICLNNMLGEEDLNPRGFHRWQPACRMTSMMAPSVITLPAGTEIAVGSGGSNRIRSAILQVLSHLIEHELRVEEAVSRPRVHYERGMLSVEGGFDPGTLQTALRDYPRHQLFPGRNMFFGGVHTTMARGNDFSGAGDGRRGGACIVV